MRRGERVRDDGNDNDENGQQVPSTAFDSLIKWAPLVVAAAAGAGLAYKAVKKGECVIMKFFEGVAVEIEF